jgi:hypothetical protein
VAAIPKREEEPGPPPEPKPGATLLESEIILHYDSFAKRYYARDGIPTDGHPVIRCALRLLKTHYGDLPARQFGPKRFKKRQEEMIKLDWSRRFINKATGIGLAGGRQTKLLPKEEWATILGHSPDLADRLLQSFFP